MRTVLRQLGLMGSLLFMVLVPSVPAQTPSNNKLGFTMDGDASFGYNAFLGDQVQSSHNLDFGGAANLKGYYYDPKFLSFFVTPYYSQSRLNSNFQSIFNSTGVTASMQLFNGGHTPGSVSYTKSFNQEGEFALPDVGTYRTRGQGQTFGIGWGLSFPKLPSFDIAYNFGDGSSNVLGTTTTGSNHYRTLTLGSGYEIKGFLLSASYLNNHLSEALPEGLDFSKLVQVTTEQSTVQLNISHRLPFDGNIHSNVNRTDFSFDFAGVPVSETYDNVTTSLTMNPLHRLTVGANVNYYGNLAAFLLQPVLPTSPGALAGTVNNSSSSWDISEMASYAVTQQVSLQGWADQRMQDIFGYHVGSQFYSGSASYNRPFLGGTVGLYGGLSVYTTSVSPAAQIGTMGSVTYTRRIDAWTMNGSFYYSRNAQTAIAAYTQSGYGYGVNLSRVVSGWRWSLNASGIKTSVDTLSNSSTFADYYNTSISGKWLSFAGSYARSNGSAIQTGTGLVPTPVPTIPIIPPRLLILYGGSSYSASGSFHPNGRLNISAAYLSTNYLTQNIAAASENRVKQAYLTGNYFFRQMNFVAGYSYLFQEIGTGTNTPAKFQSVFVGVTRHFDFF